MFAAKRFAAVVAGALLLLITASAALADDWNVVKQRGRVEAQFAGMWRALHIGDAVPDGTPIRTAANGHLRLIRGKEWVDLSPDTFITIHDKDGRQFTTIEQLSGVLEVEAEVRNVKHFAVQTRWLAAVVKGTHFVVSVHKKSASVEVERGQVKVTSGKGPDALVKKDQSITVDKSGKSVLTGAAAVGGVLNGSMVAPVSETVSETGSGTVSGTLSDIGGAIGRIVGIDPCRGLGPLICRGS